MNIIFILIAFTISAYIARLIIPRILLISFRKKLFDIPDERKVHKRAIPRLGGVSFFPTILLSCSAVLALRTLTGYGISVLTASYILPEFLVLVCGMVLLYLTGIADDLVGVRYRQKFVIQIICASLFPVVGLWVNDFYGLFGVNMIPAWFGIPFTIITVVFITNAINLIDGIDGLASGLSSASLLVFGFLFMEKGLWIYSMLAFSTFGVLVPFFYYNVFGSAEHARKIFMGDTGALFLGFTLAVMSVQGVFKLHTVISFLVPLSIFALPLLDTTVAIIRRVAHGKSPFSPDRGHLHHKLVDMGFTQKNAVRILYAICALLGLVAVVFTDTIFDSSRLVKAVLVLILALIVFLFNYLIIKSPNLRVHTGLFDDEPLPDTPKNLGDTLKEVKHKIHNAEKDSAEKEKSDGTESDVNGAEEKKEK